MGGRGPKQKGSSYERRICRLLSLWVTHRKREDIYWRSAMSGGRATVGARSGKRMGAVCGDIACQHSSGEVLTNKFLIECKHYVDLQLGMTAWGFKGMCARVWTETKVDAKIHGKLPMMISRENRKTDIVGLNHEGYRIMSALGDIPLITHFASCGMYMVLLRDMLMLDYRKFHSWHRMKRIFLEIE